MNASDYSGVEIGSVNASAFIAGNPTEAPDDPRPKAQLRFAGISVTAGTFRLKNFPRRPRFLAKASREIHASHSRILPATRFNSRRNGSQPNARLLLMKWNGLCFKLPIQRQWFTDGPFVQVESLRQSKDGRITLILDSSASIVRSLWAVMDATALSEAREALRVREDILKNNATTQIGTWSREEAAPGLLVDLPQSAESRGIDSVVWTALAPKFNDENGRAPIIEQVVAYLRGLTGRVRDNAERYIRFAPTQIDTSYRRRIAAASMDAPSPKSLTGFFSTHFSGDRNDWLSRRVTGTTT